MKRSGHYATLPEEHLLLNWSRARKTISSGVMEGRNNKLDLTTRKSDGFQTFRAAEIMLYHALGGLNQNGSTDFAEEPIIYLADNLPSFAGAIRLALADLTPAQGRARRELAAQHSWEARAEELSQLIQTQLAAKSHRGSVNPVSPSV